MVVGLKTMEVPKENQDFPPLGRRPVRGFVAFQSKEAPIAPSNDRYGLLGLLNVIRMTDQDLNMLALGCDLSSLGLNINSQEWVCFFSF